MSIIKTQQVPERFRGMKMSPAISDKFPSHPATKERGAHPAWDTGLLIGPPGTAKTTFLWAWHQVVVKPSDFTPKMFIINECDDIDSNRFDEEYLNELCNFKGCLCIDDLGYIEPDRWSRHAAYKIANTRGSKKLCTIWTTNLSLDMLAAMYSTAIASRLTGGVVVHFGGGDRRQK